MKAKASLSCLWVTGFFCASGARLTGAGNKSNLNVMARRSKTLKIGRYDQCGVVW